jgi:hypothetical protein
MFTLTMSRADAATVASMREEFRSVRSQLRRRGPDRPAADGAVFARAALRTWPSAS